MPQIVRVTPNSGDWESIKALYMRAFPENERIDTDLILSHSNGVFEILAAYEDGLFVGFVILLTAGDISHLLYFAVDEAHRGNGCGSKILQAVHSLKPGQRFIADVENPNVPCDNSEQRAKRIRFYNRNGYKMTEIKYSWLDVDYLILSYNGAVSKEEHAAFWERHADILKKIKNAD